MMERTRWEYSRIQVLAGKKGILISVNGSRVSSSSLTNMLNAAGADGWEMVNMTTAIDSATGDALSEFAMKRPLFSPSAEARTPDEPSAMSQLEQFVGLHEGGMPIRPLIRVSQSVDKGAEVVGGASMKRVLRTNQSLDQVDRALRGFLNAGRWKIVHSEPGSFEAQWSAAEVLRLTVRLRDLGNQSSGGTEIAMTSWIPTEARARLARDRVADWGINRDLRLVMDAFEKEVQGA